MPMLIIGVLLLVAKMAEFGPTAQLSWWLVLAPFAAAAIWWAISDATGLTQRRAMKKMDERKEKRRERSLVALGLDTKRQRQVDQTRDAAKRRSATMRDSTPKKPDQ